jgi:hypothetical protein
MVCMLHAAHTAPGDPCRCGRDSRKGWEVARHACILRFIHVPRCLGPAGAAVCEDVGVGVWPCTAAAAAAGPSGGQAGNRSVMASSSMHGGGSALWCRVFGQAWGCLHLTASVLPGACRVASASVVHCNWCGGASAEVPRCTPLVIHQCQVAG